MSGTKKVQMVREQMMSIYGAGCWMGYRLSRKNPYSFHHIKEARNGGRVSIDNGAILTRCAHNDLNLLDEHAHNLYHDLNDLFKELNQTKKPPTKEYFKEVNGILLYADRIIHLSSFCELNPDFEALAEFAQITHECYPDVPSLEYFIKEEQSIRSESVQIPKQYKPKYKPKQKAKTKTKTRKSNRKSYKYC